ncbi:ubiquitin-protein ligase (E3) [Podospora bellae-mahoneyi]|uniref:HECT-type E3 ubiquitin transferase n=1 Tax=Podospora bellae-mahoneyi TaxID=2093777 RepID=A0ABR0FH90_9PEZI|nr:ubiquitin-protein ligase (E3) [Podospora bellae-mahoneyi]
MFSTFTGQSTGRRRNVNLSGNTAHNPWAAPATLGASTTVSRAAAEREKRQREKEKLRAAERIQRVWRGSQIRQHLRAQDRAAIDDLYHHNQNDLERRSAKALPLLLRSFQSKNHNDRRRMVWLCRDLCNSSLHLFRSQGAEGFQLDRLVRKLTGALQKELNLGPDIHVVLSVLLEVMDLRPQAIGHVLDQYYRVMANYCNLASSLQQPFTLLSQAVTKPLSVGTFPEAFLSKAYHAFAFDFLATPDLNIFENNLNLFCADIDLDRLSDTLASEKFEATQLDVPRARLLWLLAHLIALQEAKQQQNVHASYLGVLCSLLSVLSDQIQLAAEPVADAGLDSEDDVAQGTLPAYVSGKLALLTTSRAITGLLETSAPFSLGHESSSLGDASPYAGYVLTLLSCFPNAGEEIRMRLFYSNVPTRTGRVPALEYLWQVMKRTAVFRSIASESEAALGILKSAPQTSNRHGENDSWHQQWRTILLFLELYVFVLKVTDDADFFAILEGDKPGNGTAGEDLPRTRSSGLDMESVKKLTLFLKHLGFVLYYNMAELLASWASSRNLRGLSRPSMFVVTAGVGLDKVRGLVLAAMRGLYERDSRRPFLPKDHWLMTEKFDMAGFKEAVVVEAERQRALGHAEGEEDEGMGEEEEHEPEERDWRHGPHRTVGRQALLEARQKLAAREQARAKVAPKLEVLKNLPFVVPFDQRVMIFRQFITLDKLRRRSGHADPDSWRMMMLEADPTRNLLARHQALIRRGSLFRDAQGSLYPLEEAIKEPVQITFLDQWGMQEAGIDGGGVTKEFLTSVIAEMLSDTSLFVANSKNAYYPNPLIVEQWLALARKRGLSESETRTKLLRQYEFAGRLIGKCMYEGILINVVFAGFFLLKWTTADTKQASLNDLRELDEELYRGLLFLKNNEDQVDDMGLNFSLDVDISTPEDKQPNIVSRPLCPNGNNIPVTKGNRLKYIVQLAKYKLALQPFAQTQAFLKGLKMVIEPGWLSMFNQNELQRLVGGDSGAIDVDDLRRNTVYSGPYQIGDDGQEHETVKLFWEVMEEFGDEERREVLQYVTSTPRAPLLGFSQLFPRFTIGYGGQDEDRLPSASTCINLLKLPRYSRKGVLREKLLYAVKSGAGFDLS